MGYHRDSVSEQRPSVLLVEPDAELRKEISTGLARFGYEVIPAVGAEEGVRFARGLAGGVLVVDTEKGDVGPDTFLDALPELARGGDQTLVLLGAEEDVAAELPRAVRYLAVNGLDAGEVVRRLRLVLLGQEVGVETDPALESLVGELEQSPPLELVRALHRGRFTGQVELPEGEVRFDDGNVVAATAKPLGASYRPVGGLKAFCRLGRVRQGTFHVRPLEEVDAPSGGEALGSKVEDLVIRAVEDASVGELPHPRSRIQVELGPDFFSATFSPPQQRVLEMAQRGELLGAVLDAMPETDGRVLAEVWSLQSAGLVELVEPESRLYVVTDSSADLPEDLARAHGITVVPLSVRFGERVYRDGVDLRPREFYELLEKSSHHPVTSPPEPSDFAGRYQDLLRRRDVVSVHLSEKMSQTVVHAREAAEAARASAPRRRPEQGPPELLVVDGRVVSLGLGLLALFASRMAAREVAPDEVAERLEAMSGRMGTLFVVDTLEYLRRGGRIGAARAWMGKLLGIKPILGVEGGEVVPVDRVRGGRAAHPRILELMDERVDDGAAVLAGVAHAKAPVWADRLRKLVEEHFDVREMVVAEMGPTVGAHAGPGTVGVAWLQATPEEVGLLAPPAD